MDLDTLLLPVTAGLGITTLAFFLRWYLFSFIRRLASKTKTCFDDIMIRQIRLPSALWCVWLGIVTGYQFAVTPEAWVNAENKVMAALFVSLGIFTTIAVLVAILKWYREDISPATPGNMDDFLMDLLIQSVPAVSTVLGIILVLNILGFRNESINTWLSQHLARLIGLTVVAVLFILALMPTVPKVIHRIVVEAKEEQTEEEIQRRSDTLVSVIVTTLQISVIFIYLVMVLSELSLDIAAILTGAGVLGLAFGFGAQSLVKDLIAGLFIILENQYRKGDFVKIADVDGTVEEINLRRTILRNLDGVTHVVPNGEIRIASNYTKRWARVNLNISVSYATDLEKAMAVINRVGEALAKDPAWKSAIVSPPRAIRVDKLSDSGIEIKIMGETKPARQWEVAGELRLRIKKAFDQEGIEIPWPHVKVIFGNMPPGSIENKGP